MPTKSYIREKYGLDRNKKRGRMTLLQKSHAMSRLSEPTLWQSFCAMLPKWMTKTVPFTKANAIGLFIG